MPRLSSRCLTGSAMQPEESARLHAPLICARHTHAYTLSLRPDHSVPGASAYHMLLLRRSRFIHRSLRRRRRS